MEVIYTPKHKCPHETKILNRKFLCDNLKYVKDEYLCDVVRCPVDKKLYEQKVKIVE